MDLHREGAKWRQGDAAADDAPMRQPMKEAAKPIERRKPSTDQKRIRREMQRKTAEVETTHVTAPRRIDEDDEFDPHLVTRCVNHGIKVVNDRNSQEHYIGMADQCHKDAHGGLGGAHAQQHRATGSDCWSCCPGMYIARPGERASGRTGKRKTAHVNERWDEHGSPAKSWNMADGAEATSPASDSGSSDGGSSSTAAKTADVSRAGDRECQGCGYVGGPVLADTGPACRQCGSYSLKRAPYQHPGMAIDVRPSKVATKFETNVATSDGRILINPGDSIKTPTGQTLQVKQVRRHETSRDHYYVDTDAGTTLVPWSTSFSLMPSNQQQQALPGTGTPGGNFTHMPLNPQAAGDDADGRTTSPHACPVCGSKNMGRQGGKFKCGTCGYTENPQGGGMSFGDASQIIMSTKDHRSVIARRAAVVLDQPEETL